MNKTNPRYRFLYGSWIITTGGLVLLFILGVQPTYTALRMLTGSSDLVGIARAVTTLLKISPAAYAFYAISIRACFLAIQLIIAVLILRQRSMDRFGWFVAFFIVIFGATGAQEVIGEGAGIVDPSAVTLAIEAINMLGWNLFVSFLFLFPNGRFVPRWTLWALLGWWIFWFLNIDILFFLAVAVLLIGVGTQIYRYQRVSNFQERRQTKWVVFGLSAFISSSFLLLLIGQGNVASTDITLWLVMLLPLSIGISILRGQLWDIDIVIRKTLIYGALSTILALVYFLSVILFQRVFPIQSQIATVLSTLAIAALFSPLRRRIQRFIDSRFYRQRYDAAQTMAAFNQTAREEVNLDELSQALLAVVEEAMQPESVALWVKKPQR